tara:strand:- start:244 stop:789 length:546 start_codon:yes stop_codon:yes gene_type:complete
MDYNTAVIYGMILCTVLAGGILIIGRKIIRGAIAMRKAMLNSKARRNLARMGINAPGQSTQKKPSATAKASSASGDVITKIIMPFSKEVDYTVYDEPVVAVKERLEAFLQRKQDRPQIFATKRDAEVLEPAPKEETVVAKEADNTASNSYLRNLADQMSAAFDSAPEASDEIPAFLKAQAI